MLAQPALDLAVQQVELELRRAAHAVDEREHLRARRRAEVTDARLDHDVGDLACRAERSPPAARLAVDTNADLHLALWEVEDRLPGGRRSARRHRDAERTRAIVHLTRVSGDLGEVVTPLGRRARDLLGEHRRTHTATT